MGPSPPNLNYTTVDYLLTVISLSFHKGAVTAAEYRKKTVSRKTKNNLITIARLDNFMFYLVKETTERSKEFPK